MEKGYRYHFTTASINHCAYLRDLDSRGCSCIHEKKYRQACCYTDLAVFFFKMYFFCASIVAAAFNKFKFEIANPWLASRVRGSLMDSGFPRHQLHEERFNF